MMNQFQRTLLNLPFKAHTFCIAYGMRSAQLELSAPLQIRCQWIGTQPA